MPVSDEDSATLLQKTLLLYLNRLFSIASTRQLQFNDLGCISTQDSSFCGPFAYEILKFVLISACF